jgi:hypothetical protein
LNRTDFAPGLIKLVGVLEVLAAFGLILRAVLDTAAMVLVPLAATGLALLMAGDRPLGDGPSPHVSARPQQPGSRTPRPR